MSITKRTNSIVKALQSEMAKEKKHNVNTELEWLISCNTNEKRGHVFDQNEMVTLYGRDAFGKECGATKVTHLYNHNGNEFKYIVVKRFKKYGHDFFGDGSGNQLIDEINCWLKYQDSEESDYLCPILKYFTSKSDKVKATSETMKNNVIIIAQKAVYVNSCYMACKKAQLLNEKYGFIGETKEERYQKLSDFSESQQWWDAMQNPGNSGVIFDYSKNCYKAVFIDYAL